MSAEHRTPTAGVLAPIIRHFTGGPPRRLENLTLYLVQCTAQACRVLSRRPDRRLAWIEFENTATIFRRFRSAASLLDAQPGFDLRKLTEAVRGLDPYLSLWTVEGIGFALAERSQDGDPDLRGLLTDDVTGSLPPGCLVPLHAGMGLSLAVRLLRSTIRRTDEKDLEDLSRRFLQLCEDNSASGCGGVAIEELGFVVRTLYPHLLLSLDRALSRINPVLLDYFWHGVGRGLYFALPRAVHSPCSGWLALDRARREPPRERAELNAESGFTWPLVMANIRQPEILEQFARHHQCKLREGRSLSEGFCSAILIWEAWAGTDLHLQRFLDYSSTSALRQGMEPWLESVIDPCRAALATDSARLQESRQFGELFRLQSRTLHPA